MRFLLIGALLLCGLMPTSLHAAEARKYQLRIVLLVAKHRLLTDVLADKLQRELSDGLQAALEGMANVEVVRDHELRTRINEVGLQRALEGWKDRSPTKTHFILIDYADTYYQIRALQYDGLTGQPGPIVRTEKTRDRDFVFRLAGLMIEHDFGIVGHLSENATPSGQVTLRLQGGPDVTWSRWVKAGDVFSLIEMPGDTGPTNLLNSAFLKVLTPPKDGDRSGNCICKVVNRYKLPNLAGFRAVKLGTTSSPIRLRLVRWVAPNGFAPLREEMVLYLRRQSFEGEDATRLRLPTDAQDLVDTTKLEAAGVFDNLLFVTVSSGSKILAQVPVPLLGQPEVLIPISPDRGGDDPLRVLRENWVQGVSDALLVQNEQMRDVQKLASQPDQRKATRQRAERALDRSREDLVRLKRQRTELVSLAQNAGNAAPLQLEPIDVRLKKLEEAQTDLKAFLTELDRIEQKEQDPKRQEALAQVEQARLLEREGELGKAIVIYEKVVGQGLEDGSIQAKIADLKKLWDPRSPEHADARTFIYEVYPTLDTGMLLARLAEIRQAFEECKKVGDKLGARKMLDLTANHALRIEKEKNAVRSFARPEDQQVVEQLNNVGEGIDRLSRDLLEFLGLPAPPRP